MQMSISPDGTTLTAVGTRQLVVLRAAASREADPTPDAGAGLGPSAEGEIARSDGVVGTTLAAELDAVLAGLHRRGPTAAIRSDLTELLCSWAASLIELHRTPVDLRTPVAPLPWVLREEPVPAWVTELPAVAGRAWAVRAHPSTLRAVREARSGWSTSQWVHGEAGDDVVITRAAHCRLGPVELLPGAATGRGDARWDVASALDWIAVVLGPALEPGWQLDPVADFLVAYRALGGAAEPTRALAVARTVATAVEWSAHLAADGASATVEDHEWLAALWARPLDLVTGGARLP